MIALLLSCSAFSTTNFARSASCAATCLDSIAAVNSRPNVKLVIETSSNAILKPAALSFNILLISLLTTCEHGKDNYTPSKKNDLVDTRVMVQRNTSIITRKIHVHRYSIKILILPNRRELLKISLNIKYNMSSQKMSDRLTSRCVISWLALYWATTAFRVSWTIDGRTRSA